MYNKQKKPVKTDPWDDTALVEAYDHAIQSYLTAHKSDGGGDDPTNSDPYFAPVSESRAVLGQNRQASTRPPSIAAIAAKAAKAESEDGELEDDDADGEEDEEMEEEAQGVAPLLPTSEPSATVQSNAESGSNTNGADNNWTPEQIQQYYAIYGGGQSAVSQGFPWPSASTAAFSYPPIPPPPPPPPALAMLMWHYYQSGYQAGYQAAQAEAKGPTHSSTPGK